MILSRDETRQLYRRTAKFYDLALLLFRLSGVRRLRRRAVDGLKLRRGDTVVDMGCGTGLNFGLLVDAVGEDGRVIGVDLTDAMLQKAESRIRNSGWKNVELAEADLAEYALPTGLNAAIATFALEMVPEYDSVIRSAASALPAGGRIALLGLKHPESWPDWLVDIGVFLNKPFGVSRDYAAIRPWESVDKQFAGTSFEEFYGGAAYLCIGEKMSPNRAVEHSSKGKLIP